MDIWPLSWLDHKLIYKKYIHNLKCLISSHFLPSSFPWFFFKRKLSRIFWAFLSQREMLLIDRYWEIPPQSLQFEISAFTLGMNFGLVFFTLPFFFRNYLNFLVIEGKSPDVFQTPHGLQWLRFRFFFLLIFFFLNRLLQKDVGLR